MIKKAFIYFACVTAILFGCRALHYYLLLKQTTGYYAKYKTAFLEKNNFNVIFLGSSRVEMHYDTRLFDKLTKQNSFNLSLAGATPQIAFAALEAYLEKSKSPAYLFYEIDYHFIRYYSSEIKEFNNYFPFLTNRTLRKEFNKVDNRINHFYYDPYFSFPYTGLKNLSTSFHSLLNIPNRTDSLYYKGYLKEVMRPHLKFIPSTSHYSFFNTTDRNYLDSIILLCKKNKIKISLMSSPIFAGGKLDVKNKMKVIEQLNDIALIHKITYYDYSSLPFCNRRNLFVDHFHMNAAGAVLFTEYVTRLFNNKNRSITLK
ncbi:MAG: hypothetical protein JWO32_2995 [Bacteroidetes bacterium]|nr:hypothetical protein [Bacteroidota bacterium]